MIDILIGFLVIFFGVGTIATIIYGFYKIIWIQVTK